MDYKILINSKIIRGTLLVLLFVFCMADNVFVRLAPAYFPSKQIEAISEVDQELLAKANKIIKDKYSAYNKETKEKLAQELVSQQKLNTEAYLKNIDEKYYKLVDDYQDENNLTYFIGYDTYQWVRKTQNVLNNGHPGTSIRDGKPYDDYMLAPVGMQSEEVCSLFYISAFLYKVMNFMFPSLSLEPFLFYIPLFYAVLFLTLLYMFMWRFISPMAAFITTFFIGLNYKIIRRTCVGWYEYDVLSLIAPLLIVWFLLLAFQNKDNFRKLSLYCILAGLVQMLFVITWVGWWFIFLVICAFFLCILLIEYLKLAKNKYKIVDRHEIYKIFKISFIFIISSIIFSLIFLRINFIGTVFFHIRDNLFCIGSIFQQNIFPNTYFVVSELQPLSASEIATAIYGKPIYFISLFAVICSIFVHRKDNLRNLTLIFLFWFLFMYFSSTKAVRFVIYLVMPLGIYLGIFANDIKNEIIKRFNYSNMKIKVGIALATLVIIILFLYTILISAFSSSQSIYPNVNDAWHKALNYLKENSSDESIINSYWDRGDIYKYFANRRVIFDGHTQKRPVIYWFSKAFLANDEENSLRILKMLNNASDTTYNKLNKTIKNPFKCIVFLENLLSVDKKTAEKLLLEASVPKADRQEIINDLYRIPAPAYFITDKSMAPAVSSITFAGNWDFVKVYVYQNRHRSKNEVISEVVDIFLLSPEEAQVVYNEVIIAKTDAKSVRTFSEIFASIDRPQKAKEIDGVLYFDNGIIYNPKSKKAQIYLDGSRNFKKVKYIFVTEKNELKKYTHEDGTFVKGVWIYKKDGSYYSVIMKDKLMNSLFVRLLYLNGRGLKYFKPFYSDDEAGIYIYEIDWEGKHD